MSISVQTNFRFWRIFNDWALDAAGVAVAWRLAFASALGVTVSPASLLVLGLSVWLVYLGDRWLDVRGRNSDVLPTQRHGFVARHAKLVFAAWGGGLLLDVFVAFYGLNAPQIQAGLVLLGICIVYTIGVQHKARVRWTKELQVALIFAAGIGIFFFGESLSLSATKGLLVTLAIFGLVCFVNCALIARWEIPADVRLGRQSLARAMGEGVFWMRGWPALIGVASITIRGLLSPAMGHVAMALALYAFSLQLIDGFEWPRNPEDRRCLADGLLFAVGLWAWLG
ncbi:hypothetical protein [Cerasicoccus arenae]|uniref:Uncharacterized protein n=1 Tax=Cerasicoccus arenae TaxID=424488 RepID=A0A8J3D9X4_9BACT|nr:hypothetical protein [Cerasicoccus arenae]MBK1857455.1 hypothetical protein [Cerasicoccus arenae]GHB95124.1 hypothetical protein GCM10007047_08450 [Cerasicoccus arenae]